MSRKRMRKIASVCTATLVVAVMATAASAENWGNWRGPNYDGSTDARNLPTEFSMTENVKWSVEMPGPSAATPIIWGDRVFVSSTDPESEALLALCLDRETGEELWRDEAARGYAQDGRSNYASPSPVTDGENVFFFYGTGDLIAYTVEGERLWARNLQADYGEFAFLWTFSSSPQLWGDKLYMQVLQRDVPVQGRGREDGANHSYLLALEPETGEEIWRVIRPSDARQESREAFTTPIPFEHEGREELLIAGGDDLTGHDPETGEELWRWGTWNPQRITHWRLVPSPVAGGGIVLACAPKRDPVYAIKAGGEGDLSDDWIAWVSEERGPVTSDVPTPLYYQDHFFVLSDVRKNLSKVVPDTGEVVWSVEYPGFPMAWASPTGADGKIYVMNLHGEVFIFDPESGEIINQIAMAENEEELRSTISVSRGNLFIRTNSTLYCIGE